MIEPGGAVPSPGVLLAARGISHRYGERDALSGVGLSLAPGVTALVGVNGAGKSTLMSVLAGALRPTAGAVTTGGHDLYGRGRRHALPSVALMPQQVSFPAGMTALEVVTHLTWMRGGSAARARTRAGEALEQVDLADRARTRIGALSGGMQRRVALAQALASRAPVLLLDEPSTGLDPEQRHRMVQVLRELTDRCVLLSSHLLEDVVDLARDVVVLHAGRTRFTGSLAAFTATAPVGADPARRAESAFLQLISRFG